MFVFAGVRQWRFQPTRASVPPLIADIIIAALLVRMAQLFLLHCQCFIIVYNTVIFPC